MIDTLFLGIDVGSTLCKAVVCDADGQIVAQGRSPSPDGLHGPGFDDAELAGLWRAVCGATRSAVAALGGPAAAIRAVGTSCRHLAGVFLDTQGAAVAVGERGAPEIAAATPRSRRAPEVQEVYGSRNWGERGPLGCGYAPVLVGALRWLQRHHPDLHRRVHRAGALRDYLGLRLCGAWVTDFATGPGGPTWPPAVAELSGLPQAAFPLARPMHECAGALIRAAAADLGLVPGVPVAVGAHDGACANFGAGAVAPGDGCITISTRTVVRIVTGTPVPDTFGYPVAPSGAWAWVRGVAGGSYFLDRVVAALDGGDTPVDPARHAAFARPTPVQRDTAGPPAFELPDDAAGGIAERVQSLARGGWPADAIYGAAQDAVVRVVLRLVEDGRAAGVQARRYALTGGLTAVPSMCGRLRVALPGPVIGAMREAAGVGAAMLGAAAAGSRGAEAG